MVSAVNTQGQAYGELPGRQSIRRAVWRPPPQGILATQLSGFIFKVVRL